MEITVSCSSSSSALLLILPTCHRICCRPVRYLKLCACVCVSLGQRQIARSQNNERIRIAAIATIEASVVIQEDDSADVK
jgi:hypothetical protein